MFDRPATTITEESVSDSWGTVAGRVAANGLILILSNVSRILRFVLRSNSPFQQSLCSSAQARHKAPESPLTDTTTERHWQQSSEARSIGGRRQVEEEQWHSTVKSASPYPRVWHLALVVRGTRVSKAPWTQPGAVIPQPATTALP